MNDWLRRRALRNEGRASRTYVVCSDAREVVAFYTLSAGAAVMQSVPKKLARNMPNPVPLIVLGRLAVDVNHAGRGLAKAMLRDALQRTLEASEKIGARAILVHAISDTVVPFYTQFGFEPFPSGTRTLFLPIETVIGAL